MAVSDNIQDMLALHQVYLEYYANGFVRDLNKKVDELEKDLRVAVSYYDENNDYQTKVKEVAKEGLTKFEKNAKILIQEDLEKLSKTEADFYQDTFQEVLSPFGLEITREDSKKIYSSIEKEKLNFTDGVVFTILLFIRKFLQDNSKRIQDSIDSAILLERSEVQLRSNLFSATGQIHISKHRLSVVGQTLVNHFSNKVKNRVVANNRDKIKGYQWVSIMDSRTSTFCRWADGKVWNYDTNSGSLTAPYEPPSHPNCRSSTTPIFYSYKELGLGSEYKDDFPSQPPKQITYYEWLNRQPVKIQKEVLGPTRYTMWKKDGVTPDKFYNNRGKYLTLTELQKKNIDIPKQYLQWVRGG